MTFVPPQRYEDIEPAGSALGISHALGHKLGAKYHIPHGITSVRSYVYLLLTHTK